MKKVKFNITIIFIFLFISILVVVITSIILQEKVNLLRHEKYITITNDIQNQTKILVEEKKNATLTIGMSLALDKSLIEVLKKNDSSLIKLKEFSASLRKNSDFKNV